METRWRSIIFAPSESEGQRDPQATQVIVFALFIKAHAEQHHSPGPRVQLK